MKRFLVRIILLLAPLSLLGSPVYDNYFTNEVLRFDYLLSGNHTSVTVLPCELKREKVWGGSHNNLIDNLNLGTYRFQVYDQQSGILIFSRGFSPLFQEWQSTPEAKEINK